METRLKETYLGPLLGLEFFALQLGLQFVLPPLPIGFGHGGRLPCSSIVSVAGDRDLLLLSLEIFALLHFLRLKECRVQTHACA